MTIMVFGLASLAMGAAAWHDLRSYCIPNWLSLFVAGLALAHAYAQGALAAVPWMESTLVFLAGALLWKGGVVGAGDVKLLSSCSLWFSGQIGAYLFLVSLLGGVLALGLLFWAGFTGRRVLKVPYGVAIGLAGIMCLSVQIF